MAKAEGRIFEFDSPDKIRSDFLETFDFSNKEELIRLETEEFTAVCPFSGLPDIAKLEIKYYPDGSKCLELKSLKYYLVSYRNVGLYQEGVTEKIYNDLHRILKTNRLYVKTIYNIRGGIRTTCEIGKL